jgi:hypothetical protein
MKPMKLALMAAFLFLSVATTLAQEYSGAGCSVITISKGDSVFFGGNDDYVLPDSYYWVEPGDSSRYGVIWIGTPDNPQRVNEWSGERCNGC